MASDRFTVRLIVCFLGVAVLGSLAGGFFLAANGVTVPDYLIALGSGALGALGALLARVGDSVHIANDRDDPVPVDANP